MLIEPIGVIKTPFKEKFGTPRQGSLAPSSQAEIRLSKSLPEGSLEGLDEFSHLWIFFHFHKNDTHKVKGKVFPPRLQGESMGWTATRSPHRPNAMGMTLVQLESIQKNTLFVKGVDMVDGTPVLDIKPYIASYDRPQSHHEGWTSKLSEQKLDVQWSVLALEKIKEFSMTQETLSLIEESFCQDPRPLSRTDKVFSSHIAHWDFHFKVDETTLTIQDISLR